MNEKHVGSDFDDFLREEGLLEEAEAVAAKRVLTYQISGGHEESSMKTRDLEKRLHKDRPMITISLRMPEDVVEDLKRIAPRLGFSGYQPLLRAYVGQGLRRDLEALEGDVELSEFIDSLARRGVDESVIADAMAEVKGKRLQEAWAKANTDFDDH